jgi:hypothetical protein
MFFARLSGGPAEKVRGTDLWLWGPARNGPFAIPKAKAPLCPRWVAHGGESTRPSFPEMRPWKKSGFSQNPRLTPPASPPKSPSTHQAYA